MTYRCFDVEIADHVAHVRLNRPDELNTMVPEFWQELPEIVDGISDDGSARALVVSSTGRHFTAGMDLSVFGGDSSLLGGGPDGPTEVGRQRSQLRLTASKLQDSFTAFERARMPVLVAIQGGCIGGGVDMVTAADCRYATADAFFCIQEINIGMTADVGTLQRLPKLIPEGVVREYAYTGRRMPAARAHELGLVNEVFETHDDLLSGVHEIAAEIATKSPLAVWGSKESLNYSRDHSVADGLDFIATWQTGMFQPHDMMESFSAKSDKRDPDFDDLPPVPRF
jgi:enoyl-CoA hydratase